LYKDGKVRAIGVSNFRPHHFDALLKTADIVPMVSQMRLCPGYMQQETVEYSLKRNMLVQAYSPLGHGQIFDSSEMTSFAEKYGKSVAQICIRWSLQMRFLPLPKSVNPARIKENAAVFDFELSPEDVRTIAGFEGIAGEAFDPDTINF
jgi:diketogulonate reductase-like aldo/keto reductase